MRSQSSVMRATLAGLHSRSPRTFPRASVAQDATDPVTGFPREPIHVAAWPGGKKVAVSFAFFVEEFGFGQGPVYRPDMVSRNPDLVDEAFRQYGIDWGIPRVGRLFKELDVPLTIVLSALFPGKYAIGVEGIPRLPAERADRRARHEQLQPGSAARARARRAESLCAPHARHDRRRDRRPPGRLVEPERLRQRRHRPGGGRRRHHLHARPDGLRHHPAAQDAGRIAGAAALSGGDRRHGPATRPHEEPDRRSRPCGSTTCSSSPPRRAPIRRARRPRS